MVKNIITYLRRDKQVQIIIDGVSERHSIETSCGRIALEFVLKNNNANLVPPKNPESCPFYDRPLTKEELAELVGYKLD